MKHCLENVSDSRIPIIQNTTLTMLSGQRVGQVTQHFTLTQNWKQTKQKQTNHKELKDFYLRKMNELPGKKLPRTTVTDASIHILDFGRLLKWSGPVNKHGLCTKCHLSKEKSSRIRFPCRPATDFNYKSITKDCQTCDRNSNRYEMRPTDPRRKKRLFWKQNNQEISS